MMTATTVLLYALLSTVVQTPASGFHQLAFVNGSDTTLGAYRFHLADPDRPDKATAWQGPLTISSGGKSCEADVSLVTAVYSSVDVPYVVVISYSGSSTFVHFITKSDCTRKWPRIKAFTEGIQVADDHLSILPACDGKGDTSPARCSSARVYQLSDDGPPLLLSDESLSLTKEKLGIGFTGESNISHPKSAQAQIASPR